MASTIRSYRPCPGFEFSLRIDFDLDPDAAGGAAGLRGSPAFVADKAAAYEAAGVQHLVIDFMNRDNHAVPPLTVILDEMEQFAALIQLVA